MPVKAPEAGAEKLSGNLLVHRVAEGVVYASRGYGIWRSEDRGKSWTRDGELSGVPVYERAAALLRPAFRAIRGGVFSVLPLRGGRRLALVKRRLALAEPGSKQYTPVFSIPRGNRPLNICRLPESRLYFGEYFLNLARSEDVRIWGSEDDGITWRPVWTFPGGAICHVHRVMEDPFDEGAVYVFTGDRDEEVGIHRTGDGFRTLETLLSGSQLYRAVAAVFFEEGLVYGTDRPEGDNTLELWERGAAVTRELARLPGPVLFGARVGKGRAAFATMRERADHRVSLWAGSPREGFSEVARFEHKDYGRALRELLGYPVAVLPESDGSLEELFLTPLGVKRFDGALLSMKV